MATIAPEEAASDGAVDGHPSHRVSSFDPEALFGRRAIRFSHRSTLLAMAACEAAAADAGLSITEENRNAVGITVGTTLGSLSGVYDFGVPTFDRRRPDLVNAACTPNIALNTAAGALAIRMGARGANSTVAGGPLSSVAALRHAEVTLRAEHADTVLVGASDELSEPMMWWAASALATVSPGEGAAMFVVEREETAQAAGRAPLARLGAIVVRAVDPTHADALAEVVHTALRSAGTRPEHVVLAAIRETGVPAVDEAQRDVLRSLPGARQLCSEGRIGDCYSAHGSLQLAELVEMMRAQDSGAESAGLVMAVDPDGAVGVAVVTPATAFKPAAAAG
ncbi:beta-ketoacyl synthase N-terminal-like domain-containing protein [Streptomyces sp. NPDC001137]|uniref:beta-ketoacyl synthase N-terminal-like domain-containing protein n=1 Tax=Streptomyces sp. NPDC001137 TaxID=3154378 RepID=UPI00331A1875